jgi:hypothetical protein
MKAVGGLTPTRPAMQARAARGQSKPPPETYPSLHSRRKAPIFFKYNKEIAFMLDKVVFNDKPIVQIITMP